MYTILKKADDVMNVGMMSGFPVRFFDFDSPQNKSRSRFI